MFVIIPSFGLVETVTTVGDQGGDQHGTLAWQENKSYTTSMAWA